MKGNLYVVATPIGNLEDITIRALSVLKEVDLIAAEDTRHTLKLLNHYEITKPLISYHRHNEETKKDVLVEKLKKGENIALVSDAGTPGICDPGEGIIREAIKENIKIIPIPGACAFVNALICSGMDTKEFIFLGFLPLNKKLRKQKLEEIRISTKTLIIYEAPHKLENTLRDLCKVLENRKIVLAKELTKIHEEFIRGTAQELLNKLDNLKGEFIIIIEGTSSIDENKDELNNLSLDEHYKLYEEKGYDKKEIIKKIAKDRNVSKNEIYMFFVDKK
ncbi:MAG: 16S rRNA (cytidine(1402)-2'-O)-methyltransferase [Clostridia bacterium]|nr:16S rRNA (cytidine(1402)-2'-O)-methyltransferase [Clostridia bacterium]